MKGTRKIELKNEKVMKLKNKIIENLKQHYGIGQSDIKISRVESWISRSSNPVSEVNIVKSSAN